MKGAFLVRNKMFKPNMHEKIRSDFRNCDFNNISYKVDCVFLPAH